MDTLEDRLPLAAACAASHRNESPNAPICCCDGAHCAAFHRNEQVVQLLEQDVRHAASVGQALLERHESYVADAELHRARLDAALTKLETTNSELASDNASLGAENKALLHQVERLNAAVVSSDAHIDGLTATLESTQHEMQRLAVLASRTQHLEMQLAQLEAEQALLQNTLTTTQEEERMAVQRWRESQRALAELSTQMERIELEAAEERRRHAQVVERMQRRSSVEKELGHAALRLKKAAGQDDAHRNNEVVSNFVKEILSDNATLQLNMVELQKLLSSSRDEMELLRDQLTDAYADGSVESPFRVAQQPLSRELAASSHSRDPSSELHVHHHYHAPQASATTGLGAAKSRAPPSLRPRKKKTSFSSQLSVASSSRTRSPQRFSRMHSNQASVSSINPPGSSSGGGGGGGRPKRWSATSAMTQSSFVSSGPSSPRSASVAPSTIFERAFGDDGTAYTATEYSRPTSPESNGFGSPELTGTYKDAGPDDVEFRAFSLPSSGFALSSRQQHHHHQQQQDATFDVLREEDEFSSPRQQLVDNADSSAVDANDADILLGPGVTITRGSPRRLRVNSPLPSPVPSPAQSPTHAPRSPLRERRSPESPRPPTRLRRKTSQSSLYSISGMDIHSSFTPAASNLSPKGQYKRPSVLLQRTGPSSYIHSGPILTAATAQARAQRQLFSTAGGGRALLENLAPAPRDSRQAAAAAAAAADAYSPLSDTFGRGWNVGGWLSSRWTGAAASSQAKGKTSDAPDTAGGLAKVDEDDAGVLQATSGNVSSSSHVKPIEIRVSADEWHNEQAQQRNATLGRSLKSTASGVLQGRLDEASLRECLDEDAVV